MKGFDFRLRFNLSELDRINSDAEELELLVTPSGQRIFLKSGATGTAIKDQARVAVRGGTFVSEQAARDAAGRSKRALLFWAIEQRAGIDFGDGKQRGIATNAGLRMLEEQYKAPFRNDVHGIDVFEHLEGLRFVHVSAKAQVGRHPSNLVTTFAEEYPKGACATEKQLLACEIYSSSFFDISQRSRFITLVTAVEAMLDLAKRADSAQLLVDELKAKTQKSDVDAQTQKSLLGSLEWLRYESIRQAGRALANSLLTAKVYDGKSAGDFFCSCYDLRSNLLHRGTLGENADALQLANRMEEFVAHLLQASLRVASTQGR